MEEYYADLGFRITNKIKILGCSIDQDLSKLSDNFSQVCDKVTNIANFWQRFNFSLAGRVNMVQTLMLSQQGYLGSIISPNDQQLKVIADVSPFLSKESLICPQKKSYGCSQGWSWYDIAFRISDGTPMRVDQKRLKFEPRQLVS